MALAVIAVALLVIAGLAFSPRLTRWRRARVLSRPFPPAWRSILRRNVALYARLPQAQRERLESLIQVFVAEKSFVGCAGQAIDDEVRVTIAGQACLLLLGRNAGIFPRLSNVLVYPGAFIAERIRPEPSGILQEHREVLLGESWTHGQVVLSWEDALAGGRDGDDGRNVVVHEFAHQLDQEKGHANGAPHAAISPRWAQVFTYEYARLRERAAAGEPTLIDPYGATAPQEFFAVAAEVFFERPQALAAEHPALFAELATYFRLDPRGWTSSVTHVGA